MMIHHRNLISKQIEISFLHGHTHNPMGFLQRYPPLNIRRVQLLPLLENTNVPTFAIDAKIGKRVVLRLRPPIRDDIGVRMTHDILQQHVRAMSEMDPPQSAMFFLGRFFLAEIRKGVLAQRVEAVDLVVHVVRADVCVWA